ncbi:MAG: hypothetical protein ABH844_06060 [Candidatus Omnitrophota bacterium]
MLTRHSVILKLAKLAGWSFYLRFLSYFLVSGLIVVLAVTSLVTFFPGKTISVALRFFPEYALTCKSWQGALFEKNNIQDLSFSNKKVGFSIKAEKVEVALRIQELIREKQLVLNGEMTGARFFIKQDKKKLDNIHTTLFNPDRRYEYVRFILSLNREGLKVSNFSSESRDIKITGNYTFFKSKNKVALEFKVSFSPEISTKFGDAVKHGVLSVDESGWYSTVISFKGNAPLLKALYSFSTAM